MKILGLTGGIGSGKSTVSELLGVYGIPVYDSDSRSKLLCQTDLELVSQLKRLLGPETYLPNGQLNRSFMAKALFEDKARLQAANQLIHPTVARDFAAWVIRQNTNLVVQETAILFEAGLEKRYDFILCVTAPESLRLQRTCTRSGLQQNQVLARMRNQMSEDERVRRSDFVINNDDVQPLIPQLEALLKKIS